jgi:hypothetical protein
VRSYVEVSFEAPGYFGENGMKKNKGKIIIALFSGLGNQMFHYAFYKYLLLTGINVYLDRNSGMSRMQYQKHETFRLDYFSLKEVNFATEEDVYEFIPKNIDIYLKPFLKIVKTEPVLIIIKAFIYKIKDRMKLNPQCWCEFDRYGNNKEFYRKRITKNTRAYMIGRYQRYYYLQTIRPSIVKDFSFEQEMPEYVGKLFSEIAGNNSVSIHVRRGDYSGSNELDICTINYFKNAVKRISELVDNPVYYIFSDDLEYVKNNFYFLGKYTIIDNSGFINSDYFDLYLMTNCKHNIIPNSTFSWWAAWLNQNPNKIVICPEKWNGLDLVLTDEICPPEWKREKIK